MGGDFSYQGTCGLVESATDYAEKTLVAAQCFLAPLSPTLKVSPHSRILFGQSRGTYSQ